LCAPPALRYCKRCGEKSVFGSSGLFRVNANQKKLDVWLVYNCRSCGRTWNLSIWSRVSSHALPPELLAKYLDNDAELTLRHAADAGLLKRNGAGCGMAEVEVRGPDYDGAGPAEIHLVTGMALDIKAATLIRQKLGLSGGEFAKMCAAGRLVCLSGRDLRKCKMDGEIVMRLVP